MSSTVTSQAILPKLCQAKQMMIESGVPPAVAEVNVAHLITAAAV
jgi:hypothetical protein